MTLEFCFTKKMTIFQFIHFTQKTKKWLNPSIFQESYVLPCAQFHACVPCIYLKLLKLHLKLSISLSDNFWVFSRLQYTRRCAWWETLETIYTFYYIASVLIALTIIINAQHLGKIEICAFHEIHFSVAETFFVVLTPINTLDDSNNKARKKICWVYRKKDCEQRFWYLPLSRA